jgi:outer membrane protein assembly factor BamB
MNASLQPASAVARRRRAARRVALVLALFCLTVGAMLAINAVRMHVQHPLDHPELAAMKQRVRENPRDESLQQRYRRLDAELRGAFFRRQRDYQIGGWLLLGGAALGVIGLKLYRAEASPPALERLRSGPVSSSASASGGRSRLAIGGVALAMVAAGVALGVSELARESRLADAHRAMAEAQDPGDDATQADDALAGSADETPLGDQRDLPYERQWPTFRGPSGSGIARGEGYAVEWDGPSGRHIRWRALIDLPGHNSAVVWGDRVFCTGADENERKVYAFDARDGSRLWAHRVPVLPGGGDWPPQVMQDTGYAAPTCATDGARVYAIFPNGDLIACDMEGRRVWSRALGAAENMYGYASSLAYHDGRVIVQWDHSEVARLMAFDGETGEPLWQTDDAMHASWASPVVVETGGRTQIIRLTDGATAGYDPADGARLWQFPGPSGDVASTPVCGANLTLVISPGWEMFAVPTDRDGQLDAEAAAWWIDENLPDIASPTIVDDRVYVLDTYGVLTAYTLDDGAKLWERSLDGSFNASPACAEGRLYITSTDGVTTVFDVSGDEPRQLAVNPLGEAVRASFAMVDGRIYIRAAGAMYCIGKGGGDE